MATKKTVDQVIDIAAITMARIPVHILGTQPLLMHRFSAKARRELLFPSGRKNAAEKAENLKHDPLNEYREAVYANRDTTRPTAIHLPAGMFSKALASAALDIPGASKAQILRLASVTSTQIDLFGTPRMSMEMVRSSDMAKTPDVRTRPIFPEWACKIEIEYVATLLKEGQIMNLLAAAGMIVGIGDWRPQKGGSHGKFKIVAHDDPDYVRVCKEQGRKAQVDALKNPVSYDADTEELFAWFNEEAARREKVVPSSGVVAKRAKRNGNGAEAH